MSKKTVYKIVLGSDHAGFKLKQKVKAWLKGQGHTIIDVGASRMDWDDDYPDYAAKASRLVAKSSTSKGILFCGSAEGMCIAANKIKGIRAIAVRTKELAKMSRLHNDCNVLCLSGGDTKKHMSSLPFGKAKGITETWLATEFSEEPRHVRRLKKITRLERK